MKKAERYSNFELLRVAAMLMIVIYHIICHCVTPELTSASGSGWFNHPVFYKRLLILQILNSWGQISNGVFLLISGFFLLQKGKNVNLIKIAKKLLTQQGFAAVLLVLVSAYTYASFRQLNGLNLLGITDFNNMSWYAGYYFFVVLLGELFLNSYLMNAERRTFTTFLVVMFALTQFQWTILVLEGIGSRLSTAVTGIFLYSLGGYIRRYDPFQRVRLWAIALIVLLTYALICLSAYNTTETRIGSFLLSTPDGTFYQSVTDYAAYSIVTIVLAVCMFETFKRLRLPCLKGINFLGKSTFMGYLFHDNSFFYTLWLQRDWISELNGSVVQFLLKLFAYGAATFASGVLAYVLYLLLGKAFALAKPMLLKNEKRADVHCEE